MPQVQTEGATAPRITHSLSVALVDDHTLVRTALAKLINHLSGFRVVLEAANGREFIERLAAAPPLSIVLLDLSMPIMDGHATLAWLRIHRPDLRVLVVTIGGDDQQLLKAVRGGACGYLLKDTDAQELKEAMCNIIRTGYHLTPEVERGLRSMENVDLQHDEHAASVLGRLSEREITFLVHICNSKELTYDQIATLMDVHRRTVDGYREALFTRFRIKSKVGLVLFALKWGIVKLQ